MINVQVLDDYMSLFSHNYGRKAQQIGMFNRDRTYIMPPLPDPSWVHNFAPGDLYWIHAITINKDGEWTAIQATVHRQVQRSPVIMGIVVLTDEQDSTPVSFYVNTAELDDSAFGFHCQF
ncbi:MAG: hypothetical protein GY861_05130 [bacterium]|nr:hypothetical protein [bacterium]